MDNHMSLGLKDALLIAKWFSYIFCGFSIFVLIVNPSLGPFYSLIGFSTLSAFLTVFTKSDQREYSQRQPIPKAHTKNDNPESRKLASTVTPNQINLTPPKYKSSVPFKVRVAGVSYSNEDGSSRQQLISQMSLTSKINLQREPENLVNPNAIRVSTELGCIGYIPKNDIKLFSEPLENYSIKLLSCGLASNGLYGLHLEITLNAHEKDSSVVNRPKGQPAPLLQQEQQTSKNPHTPKIKEIQEQIKSLKQQKKDVISIFKPKAEGSWKPVTRLNRSNNGRQRVSWENQDYKLLKEKGIKTAKFACVEIYDSDILQSLSNSSPGHAERHVGMGREIPNSINSQDTEVCNQNLAFLLQEIDSSITALKNEIKSVEFDNSSAALAKIRRSNTGKYSSYMDIEDPDWSALDDDFNTSDYDFDHERDYSYDDSAALEQQDNYYET